MVGFFSGLPLANCIGGDSDDRDPLHARSTVLSVDPSGGGTNTAIGIVGLYVYEEEYMEVAHAVSVSVDPRFYLYSIAAMIKAHAYDLHRATKQLPTVWIESIDRVSYTGKLFQHLHPEVTFSVKETNFFGPQRKQERFKTLRNVMNAKKIRIRDDLVVVPFGCLPTSDWTQATPKEPDWKSNLNTKVRLLVELRNVRVEKRDMDDVAMALINGVWEAAPHKYRPRRR
jgi:hypothetical protein